ncbi:hypothetical protein [Xylophilus sp. GOD-11R]|uniref:hypothetical protein n=1 Tax=Xylophilus sp. GOD-11R TaxID=3089814 RepID=UPI00298C951D|nr:hypothetical protein [Xylophilus sp. GOD-11R]WPB58525.1 hypothetical protein R9X41_07760 [Xylophilus sp. GOD-11R]
MNKFLLASLLACALPLAAQAQDAAKPAAKAATKPAAAAKPATTTKAAAKPAQNKAKPKLARSAAKAVEEVTPVDTDTDIVLSPEDIEIAGRVYTGRINCELGANVEVTADEKRPGFFVVKIQRNRYHMHPVASRTGAIRLEDPRAGALWLQLGNKSMLMNQKLGERMADECQSPQQTAMAEELRKNPPKALFEGADAPKN